MQAMVPANDIPEIKLEMAVELSIDGFGDRSFAGSVERINPMTEAGTRAILVFVQIPNPVAAIRTEAGQTFVWTIEGGKLIRRNVLLGRRDEAAARVEIKSPLSPEAQVLAARFDNLKDGGPAVLRASPSGKSAGTG